MLRGGGWFGIDEINFGIENKLYVHLRGPPPQLSAPLDFISETRIINSETFSAPERQTNQTHNTCCGRLKSGHSSLAMPCHMLQRHNIPIAPPTYCGRLDFGRRNLLLAPAARTAGAAGRLVTIIGTRGMVYDHITFAGVIMGAALALGPPKNMVWLGDFGVKT